MAIVSFSGRYAFLSNFYRHPQLAGMYVPRRLGLAPTLEHAFQASKTRDEGEQRHIMAAPTPGQAKKLGRLVDLRTNWEQQKDAVMLNLLRIKFGEGPLGVALVATGDEQLVEGNWWGDTYWGMVNGEGLNRLGVLLMQVRRELVQ